MGTVVHIIEVAGSLPGVAVARAPGVLVLAVTAVTTTAYAALLARQICTLDERDLIRDYFGIAPVEVDPGVEAWDDVMQPTINQMLATPEVPLAAQ